MKQDGKLEHTDVSPTAASASNRLYESSGAIDYRVVVQTGSGLSATVVNARTGDEAAEKALAEFMGGKVTHVAPAPRKADA